MNTQRETAHLALLPDEALLKLSVSPETHVHDFVGLPDKFLLSKHELATFGSTSKKLQHRKMHSLGMGKHVAGNAHSLANHKKIPGEVTVGEGKTVAQWKAERRNKQKRKNKMARNSRRKNRR